MDKTLNKDHNKKNWIPMPFQEAAKKLASDAVNRFAKSNQILGLGSGPMAAAIVKEMDKLSNKQSLYCITSSTQIKCEAEDVGLKIVDEYMIPEIDIVFDGADQIDAEYNMIKGGGGALLKEKVLHSTAKIIIIAAESFKYVKSFNRSVPIEIHPFAMHIIKSKLQSLDAEPKLRMLDEGYPYVTENGNFIFDTVFPSIQDVAKKEYELKSIPGILEVGLFSRRADVYYKANDDGSYDVIKF
jgi:ribose 5-phosphate isomerase A